jgi:hypothetical protein
MGLEGRKPKAKKQESIAGLPLSLDNQKARDELRVAGLGNHFDNLFDENEDRAGERYDLATGRPIDNSTEAAPGDELTAIERRASDLSQDALGSIDEPEDEATRWLRKNGGLN